MPVNNKKVLFICTYGDFLVSFEMSNISIYQSMGYEVHCAANFEDKKYNRKTQTLLDANVVCHNIPFVRKPWNIKILNNFKKLKALIKTYKFEALDIHNAVCGVIGRISGKRNKINKIIYTPHSFFFYKGCPLKNRIIYKTIEKQMAKKTDLLVCINIEDYNAALKMKIRGKALYVPGVGVNTNKFTIDISNEKKNFLLEEFKINSDDIIFVSVGELIARKNHELAIRTLSKFKDIKWKYIICGFGNEYDNLKKIVNQLGISDRVIFAGYRDDIKDILKISDYFLFPSIQEGLPVALMEAISSNIICLASNIRGNTDLIDDNVTGFIFENNINSLYDKIKTLLLLSNDEKNLIKLNMQEKISSFDIQKVKEIMTKEYKFLLEGNIYE